MSVRPGSIVNGMCRLAAATLVVLLIAGSNPPEGASAPLPQAARAAAPIVVTLEKPADRGSYPSNAFVPVSATIVSANSLADAELWVDGAVIAHRKPIGFQNRYSAHFSWQPGSKGDHTVVVRAIDGEGAFADSLPVRITATGNVSPRMLLQNETGESLRAIAGNLNVPADDLAQLNPGVQPDQLLPAGSSIFTPLKSASGEAVGRLVATPTPATSASQRSTPAVVRPASGLKLADGKLLAEVAVEKVYYYVSLGDGVWHRYPEDPNAFVAPMSQDELKSWARSGSAEFKDRRAFDVAGKLGGLRATTSQGDTEFSMEAWGWKDGQLHFLGGFQQLVPASMLPKPDLFLSAGSDLLVCGAGCSSSDTSFGWRLGEIRLEQGASDKAKFLVKTSASGWNGSAVWQISSVPFSGGFNPAPPGLITSGTTSTNTFEIDLAQIGGLAAAAAANAPASPSPTAAPLQAADPALSRLFDGSLAGVSVSTVASARSSIIQAASALLNTFTYYVRATPMAGTQPVAAPSNTIKVEYAPKSDAPGVQIFDPNEVLPGIFDVQVVDFQTFNPSSSGCAQIVRNEHGSPESFLYQVGETYCPAPFKGLGGKAWYEQLLDFVASGVDWIARAYDSVKRGVVDCIAVAIPFCSGSDVCKGVLSAGLDMAMVYAGVPPSLPSFAQLEEAGEAAFIDYVSDQLGVPCGPGSLCQDGIKATLAEMKDQAMAGGSNEACLPEAEAHALGFEPMCLPAGVVGIPVEGSMPHPASMRVRVTRKLGSPEVSDDVYARYQLGVSVTAVNNNYPAGKPIKVPVNYPRDSSTYALMCGMWPDETSVTLGSTLSGTLFTHPSEGSAVTIMPGNQVNPVPAELTGPPSLPLTVPRLKPGGYQDYTIPLSPAQPFWIPGHKEAIQKAGGGVCFDDWYTLYQGGRLAARAEVSCSPQNQWMTCKLGEPATDKLEMDMPW